MNKLEQFFTQGFNDQLITAGSPCTLTIKGKAHNFTGVLTQKSGDLEVEIGGATYIVNANVLIPNKFITKELISSVITFGNEKYFIASAVKDPFQPFLSCDLVKID